MKKILILICMFALCTNVLAYGEFTAVFDTDFYFAGNMTNKVSDTSENNIAHLDSIILGVPINSTHLIVSGYVTITVLNGTSFTPFLKYPYINGFTLTGTTGRYDYVAGTGTGTKVWGYMNHIGGIAQGLPLNLTDTSIGANSVTFAIGSYTSEIQVDPTPQFNSSSPFILSLGFVNDTRNDGLGNIPWKAPITADGAVHQQVEETGGNSFLNFNNDVDTVWFSGLTSTTTTTTSTTTSTIERCNQVIFVDIYNESGGSDVSIENATVNMVGEDQITYSLEPLYIVDVFFGYDSGDVPCQLYDIYASYLPEYQNQVYKTDWYPDPISLQVYLQTFNVVNTLNVTYNIFDYGNLNIENNIVNTYECDDEQQCRLGSAWCESLHPTFITTNSQGTVTINDLAVTKPVLCAFSRYSGVDVPNNFLEKKILYIYNQESLLDFNYTYGFTDINYEICINFKDMVSDLGIDDVYITLEKDTEIIIGNTTDTSYCFNVSNSDFEFRTFFIRAVLGGYEMFESEGTLEIGDNTFYLKPIQEEIEDDYLHSSSGYVLLDDEGINNIKVTASCKSIDVYSSSIGFYEFTNIPRGNTCTFRVDNAGYRSSIKTITISRNFTDVNLTLVLKDTDIYDVEFLIVTEDSLYTDQTNPVEGVSIKLKLNNNEKECITKSTGRCIIPDIEINEIYDLDIIKDNFRKISESIKMIETEYVYKIFSKTSNTCNVQGTIKVRNGTKVTGQRGTISIYNNNNEKVNEFFSDVDGFFLKDLDCDASYYVEATVGGVTERQIVHLNEGEGISVPHSFEFDATDVGLVDNIRDFKAFLLTLAPFLYFFVFCFIFVIFAMLWRAFIGKKDRR